MADKVSKAGCSSDVKDSEDGRRIQAEAESESSESQSVDTSEKSDSGHGSTTTDKSTVQTSGTSGDVEVLKESSDVPMIVEHVAEASAASASTRTPTFFSKARGLVSRGVNAIARSLSPKIESPTKSSSSKSPQKLKTPSKKGPSEDEGVLSGQSWDRGSSDTPKKGIVQRCKDKLLGAKKTIEGSPSFPADPDEPGTSVESPYHRLTAKEKRSKFADLVNLSRNKTGGRASPKRLIWTSQGATFETFRSDTTEELEITSVSSPERVAVAEEQRLAEVEESEPVQEESEPVQEESEPVQEESAGTSEGKSEKLVHEDRNISGLELTGRFGDYSFSNE